ncbi:SDR family NAD(P)-dependent oxidoreductase [Niveispirillum sp. SYP-B3756]|uniref:SDR family oxidoreductase n=1 Tax=Niveispirillum sp. SYP-B3756 TaxID=2662178 RepID=UPI0012911BB8|nr:SDR family oxidoreductase [Niveispirillum sp. SYP-B3756]MQP66512.1 SDR family NAD(P)-dependent oxidoreductase [Niveispirillum sp. SYP-B3756]
MPLVVITGANRGIGLELARQYVVDGWQVVATCRDLTKSGDLAGLPGVEVRPLAVNAAESIAAFAAAMRGRAIDLLIHNAGTMGPDPARQSKDEIDVAGWLETMQTNALAPILLTLALKDNLRPGAKVATLSSQLASLAENVSGGLYAYRAAKAAVNMGIRSLAADLADQGIILLALHPGWVQTDMGGPKAPVPVGDSVAGLRRVIATAGPADNGSFIAFDGRRIPW